MPGFYTPKTIRKVYSCQTYVTNILKKILLR